MIIVDGDTIGSVADTTGYFLLSGVPEGTYNVEFIPVAPYLEKTIENISVTLGIVTDLDTVIIE